MAEEQQNQAPIYSALASPIRRRILEALTREGPQDLATLSAGLGLRQITARHHLLVLERGGLVQSEEYHDGAPGRPRRRFEVVNDHRNLSIPPRRYAMLAEELIETIIAFEGEARAAEMMRHIGAQSAEEMLSAAREIKGTKKLALSDIEELVVPMIDDFGSSISVLEHANGLLRLRINNCIFFELAQDHHSVVCQGHHALYKTLADAVDDNCIATTEQCMATGADYCITKLERQS